LVKNINIQEKREKKRKKEKKREKMVIVEKCTIWTNGMVISFDEKGEQIPECGGFILDIADKLKACCDENTKWTFGRWTEWAEEANFNWYWEQKKKE
jgi:hypothetical protein